MPSFKIAVCIPSVTCPTEDEYFAVVSCWKDSLNFHSMIGHTEAIISDKPAFQTTIEIEGSFTAIPQVKVDLYACKDRKPLEELYSHLLVGSASFEFSQLLSCPGNVHRLVLLDSQSKPTTYLLTIKAIVLPPDEICAVVKLAARSLTKKSLFREDDTQLQCISLEGDIVHQSPTICGTQNPNYPEFILNISKLCQLPNKPFKLRVIRVKSDKFETIGQAFVTPEELIVQATKSSISRSVEVPLIDEAGKQKSRGIVKVERFIIKELPSLWHLLEKLKIRYSFGVDFTESHQRTDRSIQDQFEAAFSSFGKQLDPFLLPPLSDINLTTEGPPKPIPIPVWGYNAGIPDLQGDIDPKLNYHYNNTIFPISLHHQHTALAARQIPPAYNKLLPQLTQTKSSFKLKHALSHLRSYISSQLKTHPDSYFVHFIFTPHKIQDESEAVLELSILKDKRIPVSIVFVGIDALGDGSNADELQKLKTFASEPKGMDKKSPIRFSALHFASFDPANPNDAAKEVMKGVYADIMNFSLLNDDTGVQNIHNDPSFHRSSIISQSKQSSESTTIPTID